MGIHTKAWHLSGAIAVALGAPALAQAGVLFDPDGAGSEGSINVGTFDWGPTGFLADGGAAAFRNFQSGSADTSFDVLTHARLVGTTDQSDTDNTPDGLNNDYEITMSLKFTERVTGVGTTPSGGQQAFFEIDQTQPIFAEMYFDNNLNSTHLTGSGFNDGRLILSASEITSSNGNFTAEIEEDNEDLDQSNDDNQYTGQETVVGQGTQGRFEVGNITTDSIFFLTALEAFGFDFANISQSLAFNSVNPADCFTEDGRGAGSVGSSFLSFCDNAHVDGLMSAQSDPGSGAVVPDIGNPNGNDADAPDFMAQTDFNSPVQATVPEPGMLTLFGVGLAALGAGSLRRRRNWGRHWA